MRSGTDLLMPPRSPSSIFDLMGATLGATIDVTRRGTDLLMNPTLKVIDSFPIIGGEKQDDAATATVASAQASSAEAAREAPASTQERAERAAAISLQAVQRGRLGRVRHAALAAHVTSEAKHIVAEGIPNILASSDESSAGAAPRGQGANVSRDRIRATDFTVAASLSLLVLVVAACMPRGSLSSPSQGAVPHFASTRNPTASFGKALLQFRP